MIAVFIIDVQPTFELSVLLVAYGLKMVSRAMQQGVVARVSAATPIEAPIALSSLFNHLMYLISHLSPVVIFGCGVDGNVMSDKIGAIEPQVILPVN